MTSPPAAFRVAELYSNEEIYKSLSVGNAGGIRVKTGRAGVDRLVLFTSPPTIRQLAENPYADRIEGDVLTYTAAGREGDQSVAGANARIIQQPQQRFPVYGFVQIGSRRDRSVGKKRWSFLGLLQYLRGYRERQVDSGGKWRDAWVFEFRIHSDMGDLDPAADRGLMMELIGRPSAECTLDDVEVVTERGPGEFRLDIKRLEPIRRRLLSYEPRPFELLIHDLLSRSGFEQVEVTRFSQDGGIDVNARAGQRSWPLKHLLIQVQAKRWIHTVGRKEIAELRGSLQPHASGCIVTTSHFSRAALRESIAPGKTPIAAIDGYELASIVEALNLAT